MGSIIVYLAVLTLVVVALLVAAWAIWRAL
jgi:hypothetical protein